MTSLAEGLRIEYGDELATELERVAGKEAMFLLRWLGAGRWRGVVPPWRETRDMLIAEACANPKILLMDDVEKRIRRGRHTVKQEIEGMLGYIRGGIPIEILGTENMRAPSVKPMAQCGALTKAGKPCLTWQPCRWHR